jgi:hypothetical protein
MALVACEFCRISGRKIRKSSLVGAVRERPGLRRLQVSRLPAAARLDIDILYKLL